MNTFQLSNPEELLEPEELESWEAKDFDDVLQGFEILEPENNLIWNESSGWYPGSFH